MTARIHHRWGKFFLLLGMLFACPGGAWAVQGEPVLEASTHPEAVLITAWNSQAPGRGCCCGVLIAPRVVLTAAHGVASFDRWEVTVPYAVNGPAKCRAKSRMIHPDYRPNAGENDLAVLILAEEIAIDGKFPGLFGGELLPLNTKLHVVGRVSHRTTSHEQLYQGAAVLVPVQGNLHLYGGQPRVVDQGDSGGPIFAVGKDRQIVGLVRGFLEGNRHYRPTDVYVPVTRKNRSWILRQIPEHDVPGQEIAARE